MKRIQKAAAAFLTICLLLPCIPATVHAASAELRFTDPSTTVGAEVEVTARVTSSSTIQSVEATLTYDSSMLKFREGDGATGGDGTITLSGSESGDDLSFSLKFQALAEGDASIKVSSASGSASSGDTLEFTSGSSTVTIGPGDPSLIDNNEGEASPGVTGDGPKVTVKDVNYVISSNFSDALIPEGFSKTEMTYEGETCQVIQQDSSGTTAMYLAPEDGGDADFFLYNSDKGSFSPFEEIAVSQGRYIILMEDDGAVKLPDSFQKTSLTMNGKEFPVWQDTEHTDYYVVYALNSDGQKGLYRYDTVDSTYQRYIKGESAGSSGEEDSAKGLLGKLTQLIKKHLSAFVLGAGIIFILLVIIMIVIAVKLRHRNLELDDLYDEYGIDSEDDMGKEMKPKSKKEAAPSVRTPLKKKPAEDVFDDLDDDLDGDDFDTEDIGNAFDDYDDDFEDDFEDEYEAFDDDGYTSFDDTDIDDLDSLLDEEPKKKRGHMETDDSFKVDFIDLD